ncbi:hypothetical protein TNCV_2567601 [Trichonephila clavipes]|uniref:Uncharacterized protein n=1 Tax=Trichonephila clavipes TaxID=2585209 RepID=A0A8X7BMQ9_TRICX|nr:hypothetical protein TNCV_2567601 [Trichonephila clavipes]
MLLNVSRSVVHRLWNQCQTDASVFRRRAPGRPPQLVAGHFVASGRLTSASAVRRHNSSLFARLCVYPSTDDRDLSWEGEHASWTRQ